MFLSIGHPSDAQLVALIDGELASALRPGVEAHLATCAECESRTRVLQTTLTRVMGCLEGREIVECSSARARLQQSLHAMSTAPTSAPASALLERVTPPQWLQVAAVLLIGVGMAMMGTSLLERTARILPGRLLVRANPHVTLPLKSVTPGAVSSHSSAELCDGARPSRLVTDQTRRQVLERYGMSHVSADEYELDALITPELGGTTEAANLWPQRYDSPVWNARVKDDLERLLPEMVCRGEIDLVSAQQAIASDWIAAYKLFFKTEAPLVAEGPVVDDDDDDLVLLPATVTISRR